MFTLTSCLMTLSLERRSDPTFTGLDSRSDTNMVALNGNDPGRYDTKILSTIDYRPLGNKGLWNPRREPEKREQWLEFMDDALTSLDA